jgi:hypothetical protein
MKIFTNNPAYPPSRHLCSTEPCSAFYFYKNAFLLEVTDLFSIKFANLTLEFDASHKRMRSIIKFLKILEKEVMKNENENR